MITAVNATRARSIPSLDGFRACAILMVLVDHVNQTTLGWRAMTFVVNSALGVRIFFVVSGFLITALLVGEEQRTGSIKLKEFYVRRALRLLPVLYLFLVVVGIFDLAGVVSLPLASYLRCVAFTRNHGPSEWLDGHLWSLSVEGQFYLLWPVVVAFGSRWGRILFALVLIVAAPILRNGLLDAADPMFPYGFWFNSDSLMFGCIAALGLHYYPREISGFLARRELLIQALGGLIVYAIWIAVQEHRFNPIVVPLGLTIQMATVAVVILSTVTVRRGALFALLNWPWLRAIGVLSYSLYVWQQMFLCPGGVYLNGRPWVAQIPLNILCVFVAAWISYRFIERPFLQWGAKLRAAKVVVSESNSEG